MKLRFDMVIEDWRESTCMFCGLVSKPRYRFCYSTEKTDTNGNSLADFEIEVCRKCCKNIEKDWKIKCEDVSPINMIKSQMGE